MPSFSHKSKQKLLLADYRWQDILNEAIQYVDFTILETYRDRERQEQMFEEGRSTLRWPHSKHNQNPSLAVDIAPYPIDWDDLTRFYRLMGLVQGLAWTKGIETRIGLDWDRDWDHKDNRWNDGPHIEIVE